MSKFNKKFGVDFIPNNAEMNTSDDKSIAAKDFMFGMGTKYYSVDYHKPKILG